MKFNIHQIYFDPNQLPGLDPGFIPYDNSSCPNPDWREFYVFRKEYLDGAIAPDSYTGYVSWKFGQKTGLTGQQFIEFCRANPGYDVYFINPFPLEVHWGNVWWHGNHHHNGLIDIAQTLFDHVGYKVQLATLPVNLRTTSFCNFWVGNKRFWDAYMSFSLPLWDYIANGLSPKERARMFRRADKVIHASYFSFLFERLFTTFLLTHTEIRAIGYKFDKNELLSKYPEIGAELVLELQNFEAQYPNEAEPLKKNQVLNYALQYYHYKHYHQMKLRLFILYRITSRAWNLIPFREQLLQNKVVRRAFLKTRAKKWKNEWGTSVLPMSNEAGR